MGNTPVLGTAGNPGGVFQGIFQKGALFPLQYPLQRFAGGTVEDDDGSGRTGTGEHRFGESECFADRLGIVGGEPVPYVVVVGPEREGSGYCDTRE